MKLRSLHLHGFKSFADRTTLEFRDGVTAIVGSNGCGKSNIADAVRWVLGEQRASAVRGARMEEVIFQGTTRRRPLNFAEVSLLFSNEDGSVPIPQSEVEVSRKVFREGGSEYALNREACRLRDVHDLLRDTGLGSDALSIVEGGMIDAILSERADERRAMFEEAAGIGRYKDRRRTAQRRLESAEADLTRLEDLVSEVETKVRSLARQRSRARRHEELRARRLDLEVAVARAETEALTARLADAERRREALEAEAAGLDAALSAAEATAEERRLEEADLGRRRQEAAGRLEEVRRRLDAREREILLADERRSHAEMRIGQVVREREELAGRAERLSREAEGLRGRAAEAAARLDGVRERLEAREEENAALRGALAGRRRAGEEAQARVRDLSRALAAAEGERGALERRRAEAEGRLERLSRQVAELEREVAALGEQTELWEAEGESLRARAAAAEETADAAREEVRTFRGREAAAVGPLRAAEDRVSRLAAQVEAREALERAYEGFSPAVAALMAARGRVPGVLGPLADFVRGGDPAALRAAETVLGPRMQAVVVRDREAARAALRWFRGEWTGGGTLLLLPLDAPAVVGASASVDDPLPGVDGTGEGAPWVRALLRGVRLVEGEDALLAGDPAAGETRVDAAGGVAESGGMVRLGAAEAGEGILARREALERLRAERDVAADERDRLLADRDALRDALADAEERAREADELRRAAAAELGRLEAESAAHGHRRGRLEREGEEARRALDAARAAAAEDGARARELDARLGELRGELEGAAGEAERAGAGLAELEAAWERARDEEGELRVLSARAEGDLREAERALADAERGAEGARRRGSTLAAEAEELRRSLEGLSGVRARAGEALETLFADRDREAAEVGRLDARLAEVRAERAQAEEAARVSRRRRGEAGEALHRLELERTEAEGRRVRARERVEVEWGRPWEALVASAAPVEEGTPETWRHEAVEIAAKLAQLGPVNMLAVQEHEEEEQRLAFLTEQRDDLVRARDDLARAIREINRTARHLFVDTFDRVRENFQRTFRSLFQGGECDVRLADPDAPLESPIEIQASPKGKRTQRIHLLSGGERTLTALSLLFAIYLVKPSPFCLFDEVDAPLDESNVGRFIQLLLDFKNETQFVVITHNPRTMEAADQLYGVTMQEPGVSSIVGVELEGGYTLGERVA